MRGCPGTSNAEEVNKKKQKNGTKKPAGFGFLSTLLLVATQGKAAVESLCRWCAECAIRIAVEEF